MAMKRTTRMTVFSLLLLLIGFFTGRFIANKGCDARCDKDIREIEEVVIKIIHNPHNCISICNKQCGWE